MLVANGQIIGARKEQQDYFAIPEVPKGTLAIVADGMGGYTGGAISSSEAVKQFIKTIRRNFNEQKIALMLEQALIAANNRIRDLKTQNPDLKNMGTTFLAAFFIHNRVYWISVGDSTFYRWRDGNLERLNDNHSIAGRVDKKAALGIISEEEAKKHPQRHVITSGLTGKDIPIIDLPNVGLDVLSGDRFILASDGLNTLMDSEIVSIIARVYDPNKLVNDILCAVTKKKKPGQDNCTVLSLFFNNEKKQKKASTWLKSNIRKDKNLIKLSLISISFIIIGLLLIYLIFHSVETESVKPAKAKTEIIENGNAAQSENKTEINSAGEDKEIGKPANN